MIPLDAVLFYLFGAAAVASSLAVVTQRNPMHSVLLLIGSFVALAGLYINLDSPFTAVTQIIVYAGAIMVLFLFVVMLLNTPSEDVASPYGPAYVTLTTGPRRAFALLSIILLVELAVAMTQFVSASQPAGPAAAGARVVGAPDRHRHLHGLFARLRGDVGADPRRHGRRRGAREEETVGRLSRSWN